ncbi:hypothetical protein Slin15195_G087380 [Septoria linicola]|uniref:Uncharacterized protein n=1 Tax=Septoria linicola TaxID=215465 RepID=A0A9Q9AV54_9PEZI|nr:hypothetical protein Slin14017_G089970 [Septoria linicola]USW55419.1 hypothetical protein Slin15195_G087380 [Septoria linicola]
MAISQHQVFLAILTILNAVVFVSGADNATIYAPVPIGLGGKEPAVAKEFIRLMLPEYDVVHVIHSSPNGKSEFLPLLTGEETIPVSGLGSNVANGIPQVPRAIFIGGGFSPSEINEMYGSSIAMQDVPWVYPTARKRDNGTVIPPVAAIVARVKQVFAQNGLVPGNDTKPTPGLWSF